ncbi:LytTR family DNA-binding domain-containing protein [Niveispirillum sp.]|uniref:LytR/AlgR family response regulator transcription factor n=1 Tax=Niveispirillum sp. TaxID=1917217 RepID=UPI001B570865|nr:LytTR family DNA-binding domain-containing protein [Niveispirillum sp.]MBP7338280.1 response regulator transcription factor [Niveispirillum sp.]
MTRPTALVAEDEPLLRDTLIRQLSAAWPDLAVVAEARNGRQAVDLFERHRPAICFLDVQMPGMTGVEAARLIGRRAHLVFVTAFDQYAVEAFTQGALDYLVKPVAAERLADTVERLQTRLRLDQPSLVADDLLARLAAQLRPAPAAPRLSWLRASTGPVVRMIAVEEVEFLLAGDKYTHVGWRGADGIPQEAVIRTPIKDLAEQLDPDQFTQVHRGAIVALRAVSHVVRTENDTGTIHLKNRAETIPVSRAWLPRFRGM